MAKDIPAPLTSTLDPAHSEPTSTAQATGEGRFASLAFPNYRWYWFSTLAAFSGMQMQQVSRGWLIYSMNQSPIDLALVVVSFALPMSMLSLLGGTLADRLPKRLLIMFSQSFNAVASGIVGFLVLQGSIQLWHLLLAGVLNGILIAMSGPARMAIVPELVGRERVVNAIALSQSGMNLTRIGGPALAGVLIPLVGIAGVFFIMAGLYGFAALSMLGVRQTHQVDQDWSQWKLSREMLAGLRYVYRQPLLLSLLGMAFVAILLGMPVQFLLPAFVVEALEMEAVALGFLMMVTGIGALIGSLMMAGLGGLRHKGRLLLAAVLLWGVSLLIFSVATDLVVAGIGIFLLGFASAVFMTLSASVIQLIIIPEMYGRVMSMHMMIFGMMPLAVMPMGVLAEAIGTPEALTVTAMLLIAGGLALLLLNRPVRRLEV